RPPVPAGIDSRAPPSPEPGRAVSGTGPAGSAPRNSCAGPGRPASFAAPSRLVRARFGSFPFPAFQLACGELFQTVLIGDLDGRACEPAVDRHLAVGRLENLAFHLRLRHVAEQNP